MSVGIESHKPSIKRCVMFVLVRPTPANFSVSALGPMHLDLHANMNYLWQLVTGVSGKHQQKCFVDLGLTGTNTSCYFIGGLWLLRACFPSNFPLLHPLVGVGSYIFSQSQSRSSQFKSQHFFSVCVQLRGESSQANVHYQVFVNLLGPKTHGGLCYQPLIVTLSAF